MTSAEPSLPASDTPAGGRPAAVGTPALRRLANAVIWPGFVGTALPDWLAAALREGLAGVVYFAHNIDPDSPDQVRGLSAAIRDANPDAVIGVDEEGGNVTRLQARSGSTVPGAAVLGALDETTTTEAAGRAIGRLCHDAGINLAIAPVADVNTNPLNPVIGVRSFGSDTDLVSRHTAAAVTGIQSTGVGACAKHFPGHGDTVADSHLGAARVELPLAELAALHLPPFRAAVRAGVQAVMTAHIIVPEMGPAPATLNPAAGTLLRSLGFAGLQITDALDMAAVRATVGPGEGAVLSLLAGADLLCVGNPRNAYTSGADDQACYLEVRDAVVHALEAGRLSVGDLRRAAARVTAFARWSREHWAPVEADAGPGAPGPGAPGPGAPGGPAGAAGGARTAEPDWIDVAARSCRIDVAAGPPAFGPGTAPVALVDARTGYNLAAGPTANFFAAALRQYRPVTEFAATGGELDQEVAATAGRGEPVVLLVDALRDPDQHATLARLGRLAPAAVCINSGMEPVDDAGSSLTTVHCHGSSRVSAAAVARLLLAG